MRRRGSTAVCALLLGGLGCVGKVPASGPDTSDREAAVCDRDAITCGDGSCTSAVNQCNGIQECTDGADERA